MARLRIRREGRGRVVLEAFHALRVAEFRRALATDPHATACKNEAEVRAAIAHAEEAEAAAVEGLTPEEERWVRDLLDPWAPSESGSLVELVERRFGPIPPEAPAPEPLRLLPPNSRRP